MDVCPLCHHCLEEGQDLQLHYILCPANTEKRDEMGDQSKKSVRLRWAKVVPCVERIVHLISSLDDSIPLHWSDTEGLYESALTRVPVGIHSCTLAVGGDIIPVDEFEVNERSDTIYIIPIEEEEIPEEIEGGSEEDIIDDDDDPVGDLLASASLAGSNDLGKEEYPSTSGVQPHGISGDNLSPDDRKIPAKSRITELSPLYKELLQHQVLHGEPAWVPRGDDQSPTISDDELNELMTRTGTEEGPPPHLTSQPANPEERHLKSPVPIRPISNKEERVPDTLPGTRGEGTEERGLETRDVKGRDDHHSNESPAASSSTYSGSNSEHSSARNTPDMSDGANDSDGSDALQEQSLEEAIPRDSPEIQELPRPYDGTFLTRDIIEDEKSPREKKPSSPIPLGFTPNQSSTRASPHIETRGGSVPGSRGSASPHSETRGGSVPGSRGSASPHSETRGGSVSGSRGSASPHSETRGGSVPGSRGSASPHSETRGDSVPGSRGSPVTSVHSLDGIPSSSRAQESTQPSITSLPDPGILQGSLRLMDEEHKSQPGSGRDRTPGASSPAGSTHSSVRKRSIEDIGSPPLSGRGRTPPVSSPLGSVHSSTRSSRGHSPIASGSSLPGQGTINPGITSTTAISTSPAGSVHSSTRSPSGQSPTATFSYLPGQGIMHDPGTTSPAAISSLHSSTKSTPRGSSPVRRTPTDSHPSLIHKEVEHDVLSRHSQGSSTFSHGKGESPRSSSSRNSFLENRDTNPAFSREFLGNLSPRSSSFHSRVSPALSHGSREGYGISSQRLIDSFDNIRDHRTIFTHGPSGDQRPRSSERSRYDGHRGPEGKDEGMFPEHFIPSSSSAFAPMNGDRTQLDVNHNEERKAILREQERFFQEKQLELEAEIRRLRKVNEDLNQQLLSVEAAVALSEGDNQRSQGLEATVASLNDTVNEKDEELAGLKKRCEELEKSNQEMKDEQESLKTVNKLTYEDLNKENLELRTKMHAMQRKSYGSPMRTHTSSTDEILNKILRENVTKLEADKRELKQKYNKIKLELEQTKAEKTLSDSRLRKARSETDLSEKFNRYTTYSKPEHEKDIYDQNWAKTSSGLGSSRYSWSDNNFESSYKVGASTTQDSGLTNGLSSALSRDTYSPRKDDHVTHKPLYSTSHQRRRHSSIDDDIDVISDTLEQDLDHRSTHAHDRQRTLSSESSNSSLLEYEYGANTRVPYAPSTYSTRDTRVELRETSRGRRVRPHSYHADTVLDSERQTANGDINHFRSLSHSPSRVKAYGSTYRTLDYETSSRPVDFESKSRTSDYGSLPNRYGTKSTATTPYSTTTGYPRVTSKPFCPTLSKDIDLGMRVMVARNSGICGHGIVKYVGLLPGRDSPYVGVELDNGDGRHDGSFQGQRFFKCKPNRGIFVRLSKVLMCYPK